jgi:hypothetical protein
MKKIITGASVLLTGAILFLAVFCATGSIGMPDGFGWDQSGRFWNAMSYAKLIPFFVISIMVMIAGTIILIWGNIKES